MPGTKLILAVFFLLASSFAFAQRDAEKTQESLPELFKQREDILQQLVEIRRADYQRGVGTLLSLNAAETRLLDARLETARNRQDRIEILESQLSLSRQREELITKKVAAGLSDTPELMESRVARLNVQISLHKER